MRIINSIISINQASSNFLFGTVYCLHIKNRALQSEVVPMMAKQPKIYNSVITRCNKHFLYYHNKSDKNLTHSKAISHRKAQFEYKQCLYLIRMDKNNEILTQAKSLVTYTVDDKLAFARANLKLRTEWSNNDATYALFPQ